MTWAPAMLTAMPHTPELHQRIASATMLAKREPEMGVTKP